MKKQLLSIIFILPILLTACGSNISTGSAPLAIQETSAAAKPIVESIDTTSEETHSPMEDVPEPAVIRYDGFTLTEIRITEEYPENTFPAVWAAYLVPDCEHIITMHNAVYPNSIGITEMYQYGIADRSGQTVIPCIYDMILCTDKGEYILIGGPEDGLYDKDLHLLEAGYYTHGYEVLDVQYFYLYHDNRGKI